MLRKTRGIVLHVTHYAETSIVVKIYTEEFGLQSYLINGVRKQKSKFNNNLFQSLSLVELVAYHKAGTGLRRVSEISSRPQFGSIPYDVIKSSVAIFLNELIYRSIREEEKNQPLFDFLHNAIRILDLHTVDCSSFHLYFVIQFTRYLGFFPNGTYYEDESIFNLEEGNFQLVIPAHPHFLNNQLSKHFYRLMHCSFENYHLAEINHTQKKELLTALVTYFELHHTHGSSLKSHHVLHEVMN
ncbi:MAG: DNA repair protein RecO [Bacteroidia bacterium]